LLIRGYRTATVKALTYCDVFVLDKDNLDQVLVNFPEEKLKMMNIAESRMALDTLRKLIPDEPIFYAMDSKVLNECVDCFVSQNLEVGDYLFKQGSTADCIHFLGMGNLDVVRGGEIVSTVSEGNFIGVVDFILARQRAASLKAASRCTVFVMGVEDWINILNQYSEHANTIYELGKENEETWDYLPEEMWENVIEEGIGEDVEMSPLLEGKKKEKKKREKKKKKRRRKRKRKEERKTTTSTR